MNPRTHVWRLMIQKGIGGVIADEALADLIKHVQRVDAAKLRNAHPSLGDVDTLEQAAQFLEDPALQAEYLEYGKTASPLNAPCSCDGCTGCVGREIGCTCDVDWDEIYGRN